MKENEFHERVVNTLSRQEYELYFLNQNAPTFFRNALQEQQQDKRQQEKQERNRQYLTIDSSPSTGIFSEEDIEIE